MRFTLCFAAFASVACGGRLDDIDAGVDAGKDVATDVSHDVTIDAGDPCVLAPTSYDTTCNVVGDCAYAFFGNACTSACACVNGAISKKDEAKYEANFEAVRDGGLICPCPMGSMLNCCAGECTVGDCN